MAYIKTTWTDNEAPYLNATNLNKIEGGIYNNSVSISSVESEVKEDIANNSNRISTNATAISVNAEDIATNAEDIANNKTDIDINAGNILGLSVGEVYQGTWTPEAGTEYPASPEGGWSYYIQFLDDDGYEFVGGDLTGRIANNGDKIIYNGTAWSMIDNTNDMLGYYLVDDVSSMLSLSPLHGAMCQTYGYHTANDGGGGTFNYNAGLAGTNNGGTIIDGWVRQYSGSVYASWFGAIPDYDPVNKTGTDTTDALSKVWEYVYTQSTDSDSDVVPESIIIGAGYYKVSGSINWTASYNPSVLARNISIDGSGAVLYGVTADKLILDMTGSRFINLRHLSIVADETITASIGLQIGTYAAAGTGTGSTCGSNMLTNLYISGNFFKAPLMNSGSETSVFNRVRLVNHLIKEGTGLNSSYAYIADGNNLWDMSSEHLTVNKPVDSIVSFTVNHYISCEFRNLGGGSSVWGSAMSGHTFNDGCYFISFNDTNFVLYSASDCRTTNLVLRGHYESAQQDNPVVGNTGVSTLLRIEGNGTASLLYGLEITDSSPHASDQLIDTLNTSTNTITGFNCITFGSNVTSMFHPTHMVNTIINGSIVYSGTNATFINLSALSQFNGIVEVKSYADFDYGNGTVSVVDETGSTAISKEIVLFDGIFKSDGVGDNPTLKIRAKDAGRVAIGNDLNINVIQCLSTSETNTEGLSFTSGSTTIGPKIGVIGSGTDVDLRLEGKGAGKLRMGTYTAGATAPTGYITIKDNLGIERKIAVE